MTTKITTTPTPLELVDTVNDIIDDKLDKTGTAAAASTLTGLTATVAELNYVDGVTSNIQTQLDGKLSINGKAASATTADSAGNVTGTVAIANGGTGGELFIKDASISGTTITLTYSDDSTETLTTQDTNTTYSAMSASEATTGTATTARTITAAVLKSAIAALSGGSAYQLPYATCSTAYSTGAKVATITNGVSFSLVAGARVAVKFTASKAYYTGGAGTVVWASLNVDSTGAKTIKAYNTTDSSLYVKQSGGVYEFVYDGTYWNMASFSVDS